MVNFDEKKKIKKTTNLKYLSNLGTKALDFYGDYLKTKQKDAHTLSCRSLDCFRDFEINCTNP